MSTHLLPVLAADFSMTEVIWAAVVTIIFIGSWIVNKIKGTDDQTATEASEDDEATRPLRLEELATRRRAQMQSQAEGGQGASPASGQPGGDEPQNLTLAERIERARARAQYAQRAESLQKEQGGPQRSTPQQPGQGRPQQPAARRPAPTSPPRPPAAPQRAPARVPPIRRRPRVVPEEPIVLPRLQSRPQPPDAARPKDAASRFDDSTVISGLAVKASETPKRSVRPGSGPGGWRGSLQQAIVLKEILDRPLSLRAPDDPY